MSTLTDRYVAAVLRRIPEAKRGDIEAELRASIDDMIDARLADGGASPAKVEAAVLTELGDPNRLAADYSGWSLYLIGPALFLDYLRLLGVLLLTVPPIVLVVILVINLAELKGIGPSILTAGGTAVTVALHIAFWTTVLFAVLERTPAGATPLMPWNLTSLPPLTSVPRVSFWEATWGIVSLVIGISAIFVQQSATWAVTPDGDPIPLINPDLWSFWLPYLIGVMVLAIVLILVTYRVGHWTTGLAIAGTVLNLAFAVPVIWLLATGQLLNPAFFAYFDWPNGAEPSGWLTLTAIAFFALTSVWASIDGFVRARRYRVGTPTSLPPS